MRSLATRIVELHSDVCTSLHGHECEREIYVLFVREMVHGGSLGAPVGEGDTVFIPPVGEHCLANEGADALRSIGVISRWRRGKGAVVR